MTTKMTPPECPHCTKIIPLHLARFDFATLLTSPSIVISCIDCEANYAVKLSISFTNLDPAPTPDP